MSIAKNPKVHGQNDLNIWSVTGNHSEFHRACWNCECILCHCNRTGVRIISGFDGILLAGRGKKAKQRANAAEKSYCMAYSTYLCAHKRTGPQHTSTILRHAYTHADVHGISWTRLHAKASKIPTNFVFGWRIFRCETMRNQKRTTSNDIVGGFCSAAQT